MAHPKGSTFVNVGGAKPGPQPANCHPERSRGTCFWPAASQLRVGILTWSTPPERSRGGRPTVAQDFSPGKSHKSDRDPARAPQTPCSYPICSHSTRWSVRDEIPRAGLSRRPPTLVAKNTTRMGHPKGSTSVDVSGANVGHPPADVNGRNVGHRPYG